MNGEVFRRMKKWLTTQRKKRKFEYIGHVMRGDKYNLLRLIIICKIRGKEILTPQRIERWNILTTSWDETTTIAPD